VQTQKPKQFFPFLLLLMTTAALLLHPAHATSRPALTGDFHLLSGITLTSPHHLTPGVQRLTVNLDHRFDAGRFFVRSDIRNRFEASSDSLEWTLPEAWLEFYFESGDLRIGRQILKPGLSLIQSPLDRMQPMDLRSFLLEPEDVLRRGTVALEYSWYSGDSRIRIILTPVSTRTLMPDPGSRWFFHLPVPAGIPFRIEKPDNRRRATHKPQAALLWNTTNPGRYELQAGLLYWTPSRPAYRKQVLFPDLENPLQTPELLFTESYFSSWILTGAISWEFSDAVTATAEAAWFHDRAFDRIPEALLLFDWDNPDLTRIPGIIQILADEEDDFISRHSVFETLLELRYSGSLLTLGAHWSTQIIQNPHPDVIQDDIFHLLAATARRDFFRQRLASGLTVAFQPNGNDYWIRTEHTYDLMDNVSLSAGAHFFGGPVPEPNYGHASFGSYRSNSLVHAGIRYFF